MNTVIENEAFAAFAAKWDATDTITAAITGGLHQEPTAKKTNAPEPGPSRPAMPYATLLPEAGASKRNEYSSNGDAVVYVDLTLCVYGVGKAATGKAIAAVEDAYDTYALALTFPAGLSFMRLEAVAPAKLTIEDKAVAGDDVWKGVKKWILWLHKSPT